MNLTSTVYQYWASIQWKWIGFLQTHSSFEIRVIAKRLCKKSVFLIGTKDNDWMVEMRLLKSWTFKTNNRRRPQRYKNCTWRQTITYPARYFL